MNAASPDKIRPWMDTAAVALSGVCVLHCLALPIMLTALPVLNVTLLEEDTFHTIMLLFILPVSLVALSIGCRQHKDRLTLLLGTAGLTILTVMAFFGHDLVGLTGERLITSAGGIVLALAHIQNYRCCRRHNCQHDRRD